MADAENPQEFASILCDPLIFRFLLHLVNTADTSLDRAGKLMQGLQRSMSSAVFGLGKPGGSFETGAAQPTLLGYEHHCVAGRDVLRRQSEKNRHITS